MSTLRPHSITKWLLMTGLLIVGSVIFIGSNPGPAIIETTYNNATIFFASDHRIVLSSGTCISLSWRVEQIQEVYVNGEGVTGSGERGMCVGLKDQPSLRVVFQDGSEKTYKLEIPILLSQPGVWFLIAMGISATIASVCLQLMRFVRLGRRIKIVIRVAVGVIFTVVITLLILEASLRTYYSILGTPDEHLLYTDSKADILPVVESRYDIISAPYVNYVLNPNHEGHNQLGYRGPEIVIPKPQGIFRIVVLGDSITYGQTLKPTQTFPAQIQQVLRDDYGYHNVEVVNAGVVGYTSWEALTNLSFRILNLEPDLIIFYGSSNDVHARLGTPDCYQGLNPRSGLDPLRQVSIPQVAAPNPSTLYRYLAVNLGWVTNPLQLTFDNYIDPLCNHDEDVTDEAHLSENLPIYFRRNLRNIVAVAQVNQMKVILSTQAYYRQTDPKVMTDWWKQAVDAHNSIIKEVAEELQISGYDLASNIDQQQDFWLGDGFHLSATGANEYGKLYAAYIVSMGWLEQPQS